MNSFKTSCGETCCVCDLDNFFVFEFSCGCHKSSDKAYFTTSIVEDMYKNGMYEKTCVKHCHEYDCEYGYYECNVCNTMIMNKNQNRHERSKRHKKNSEVNF
jgi:hypothetical protein